MFKLKILPKGIAFLFLCLMYIKSAQSQSTLCSNCYIWEFTNKDGERDNITEMLSNDFEDILSQKEKCSVLQRSKYATLYEQIKSEKGISSLANASSTVRTELTKRAKNVIFGEISKDFQGNISLRVSFENLQTTQLRSNTIFLIGENAYNFDKRRKIISEFIDSFLELNLNPIITETPKGQENESLVDESAEIIRESAFSYYSNKEYNRAIQKFNQLLQYSPNDIDLLNGRGYSYYNLGKNKSENFELAITDFTNALNLDMENISALKGIGNSFYHTKRYKEGIEKFNQILAISKDDHKSLKSRGNCYNKLGMYKKALKDYQGVLKLIPDDYKINRDLGSVYIKLKEPKKAVKYLERALELNPEDNSSKKKLREAKAKL